MGLFDKFRKKKKEEVPKINKLDINPEEYDTNEIQMSFSPSSYTSPNYTSKRVTEAEKALKEAESKLKKQQIELEKTERENERLVNDVESRLDALDDLPGAKRARNIVAEETRKLLKSINEKKEKEFNEKYGLIASFEAYTSMGVKPGENVLDSNIYDLYQSLPGVIKQFTFIPYYLEKKELGIATEYELNKLKKYTDRNQHLGGIRYEMGLAVLDMLGLTDVLDESNFSASYAKYSDGLREKTREMSNEFKCDYLGEEPKKPMTR